MLRHLNNLKLDLLLYVPEYVIIFIFLSYVSYIFIIFSIMIKIIL